MNNKHMTMVINNIEKTITISTEKPELGGKGYYIIYESEHKYDEPIGGLLFSFITANFNSLEDFKLFVESWGLPGLLQVVKNSGLTYEYTTIDENEYNNFVNNIYELTHSELTKSQNEFKAVVDFCINTIDDPNLKELTPLQRYYFGSFKNNLIPDLNKYGKEIHISHGVDASYSDEKVILENITCKIKTIYHTQNISAFAYQEFFNLLNNFSIGKCSNCKEYFVPLKINEIYCESCRGVGYINKVKNDDSLKAYNTTYKTRHAEKQRKIRGKSKITKQAYESALAKWKGTARLKLKEIQEGVITFEEFENSLEKGLELFLDNANENK
jgi:hypothetical protein